MSNVILSLSRPVVDFSKTQLQLNSIQSFLLPSPLDTLVCMFYSILNHTLANKKESNDQAIKITKLKLNSFCITKKDIKKAGRSCMKFFSMPNTTVHQVLQHQCPLILLSRLLQGISLPPRINKKASNHWQLPLQSIRINLKVRSSYISIDPLRLYPSTKICCFFVNAAIYSIILGKISKFMVF